MWQVKEGAKRWVDVCLELFMRHEFWDRITIPILVFSWILLFLMSYKYTPCDGQNQVIHEGECLTFHVRYERVFISKKPLYQAEFGPQTNPLLYALVVVLLAFSTCFWMVAQVLKAY